MVYDEAEDNGPDSDHGFAEDFDDFEEGAMDDEFGDFDAGFQQPEEPRVEARQAVAIPIWIPPSESSFVSNMIAEIIAHAKDALDPDVLPRLRPTNSADTGSSHSQYLISGSLIS